MVIAVVTIAIVLLDIRSFSSRYSTRGAFTPRRLSASFVGIAGWMPELVYGTGLENRRRFTPSAGSNPAPSAFFCLTSSARPTASDANGFNIYETNVFGL